MTNAKLSYNEIDKALLDAVPEMKDRMSSTFQRQNVQPYAVVVLGLKPFLRELLDQGGQAELLQKTFAFVEEMAHSSDIEVVNLLQVGLFESLVREPNRLVAAWSFMGQETKKIARNTARIWRCEKNLPEKE